jgi:hypothetical protein
MVFHFSTVFLLILCFFKFRKEKIERKRVCGKEEGWRKREDG